MTIDEIERGLPSSFHDAILKKIEIDYLERILRMEIDIDVSDPDCDDDIKSSVVLNVYGLIFCILEPPDFNYYMPGFKGAWIADSSPGRPKGLSFNATHPLPAGSFEHFFYINNWNSFIIIAAMNAELEYIS